MNAEIIAIGNEVVDGTIVNSNAAWLSDQLLSFGVSVQYHTAIPDDEKLMLESFRLASQRAPVVLVTGGLGPTVDDFTLEMAAKFFDQALVEDSESLQWIRNFFKRLNRDVTPNQEKQALIPESALVLANRVGTAPGIYYQHQDKHFAFFPGVPGEMKAMFTREFVPILEKIPGRSTPRLLHRLQCFGLPEGKMDFELRKSLEGRLNLLGAQLGFRVRFPFIEIRLQVLESRPDKAQAILKQAKDQVYQKLKKHIFGEGETTLSQVLGDLLKQKNKTLATAESCTGGLLANLITDIPGASEYFLEGVVSYSNQAKMDLLGVKKATLDKHGAVSSQVALEMAHGIQKQAGSDFGVAITGIAGPGGGTSEKPAGTVHIAVIHEKESWEREFHFPFDRLRFKQVTVATALDRVRRSLV